uniref:Vesicle transport v-SNARE N-terminal domain-containing protein n=1 Tax=Chromera velia CCMP2878 TaxID=1169474 RepID=A0A0G4F1M1_9ALVE|mmetsp:Transcript_8670/g.16967  ORF Transcript_8670/g.16967 Transcript_8670/m.16967 type:complete len:183 (-) Transcript_8670:182-730(-)|eukprot:Cvel_2647.t1-p1 / transcript=Cvel_2647.t1 / gene=Cvel_2647 / organism=Chromera_velia_CCMP2878 / gene_product=hypothetical protein / transcript_product=hypothetical protein / location=Cvel_scaffold105:45329-47621(-) / protein_length=182 / sequence_SO=supercontig / SO=protein_coding / is_pseudo=false
MDREDFLESLEELEGQVKDFQREAEDPSSGMKLQRARQINKQITASLRDLRMRFQTMDPPVRAQLAQQWETAESKLSAAAAAAMDSVASRGGTPKQGETEEKGKEPSISRVEGRAYRQTHQLEQACRTIAETGAHATETVAELRRQREVIEASRAKMKQVGENVETSNKAAEKMRQWWNPFR